MVDHQVRWRGRHKRWAQGLGVGRQVTQDAGSGARKDYVVTLFGLWVTLDTYMHKYLLCLSKSRCCNIGVASNLKREWHRKHMWRRGGTAQ